MIAGERHRKPAGRIAGENSVEPKLKLPRGACEQDGLIVSVQHVERCRRVRITRERSY
jgi:hypothetical protein